MTVRILLFFGVVMPFCNVWGQQDPLYTQYLTNPVALNPAYTGVHNRLTAVVHYRAQWLSIEDSPRTFTASAYSSLYNNKVGGGLLVLQDEAGFVKTNEAYLMSSYKIAATDYKVSFGLQAGVISRGIDYSKLNLDPDALDDPQFSGVENVTRPNFGAGIIYSSKRVFAGISSPRLSRTGFSEGTGGHSSYNRHFYGMGAFVFPIDFDTTMKPSLLIRASQGVPVACDFGLTWIENQLFSAGFFTRSLQTFGFIGGVKLKETLQLGYSFEIPTNKNLGFQYNTHEVTLRLDMKALAFHQIEFSNF